MKKTSMLSILLLAFIFLNIFSSNDEYAVEIYAAEQPNEIVKRDANNNISEVIVKEFFSNGQVSKQYRYFGGTNLKSDVLVYNQYERKEFDSNGNVVVVALYQNFYSDAGKQTIRIEYTKNTITNNRIVKSVSTKTDGATNLKSQQEVINYNNNGLRQERKVTKYSEGNPVSKTIYTYNRQGQLKSNNNGNAYRKVTNLETNTTKNYQYNSAGKAARIKG